MHTPEKVTNAEIYALLITINLHYIQIPKYVKNEDMQVQNRELLGINFNI